MIDMRYHVFSLVAVFLALGIGMLLGTTLVERGLIAEQKAQIKSLKQTFDDIKVKNSELNDQLGAYVRYAEESKAYMVTNMLPGKTYAVLTSLAPDEGALGKINEAVTAAGATIPITILLSGSDAYNEQVVANLASLFHMTGSAQDMKQRVFAETVSQLMSASNAGILQTLQQLGVMKVRGSLPAPVSAAILLGPVELQAMDKTDTPLISNFTVPAFPLVGVTPSSAENGILLLYKKRGISTVDHVDSSPGQVALDMVLSGRTGNYGSGAAASRVLPPP